MRILCHEYDLLPSSLAIPQDVILDFEEPIAQSAVSDVYRGSMGDKLVAIKNLRLNTVNEVAVKHVRSYVTYHAVHSHDSLHFP
jgi:hypothetical protein